MFLDEATIDVTAGKGGDGMVHWRREKYVAKGGPDGGDGGNGANVYLIANANTDTLSTYASKKVFKGEAGKAGGTNRKTGKSGKDTYLKVPPGTFVTDVSEHRQPSLIADLASEGDQVLLCRGGRGGYGNAHFKGAARQRPDFAEIGEPGQHKRFHLELKLVADVGIIGFPSVGKSTLISVISAARPKIAEYEFTTLTPNLGMVEVEDRGYMVCDVPGLIEGAAEGKGLGHQFLKHIERCGLLIHLLDVSRSFDEHGEPQAKTLKHYYDVIRSELMHYSPTLAEKRELIVLNKIDLIPDRYQALCDELKALGIEVFMPISAATHENTSLLSRKLLPIVLEEREHRQEALLKEAKEAAEQLVVLRPHEESDQMGAYRIEELNGKIIVSGKRIEQLTVMTDFKNEGAARRWYDVVERIGLKRALNQYPSGKPVFIGETEITAHV